MAKKRQRARVAKDKRRNLRNWAEGARETVLAPHIEPYADAVEKGWRAERDYFALVCNKYHARINWELEDHEEPNLPLAPFDPHERLAKPQSLGEEEEARRDAKIEVLNLRIRRWLKYRVKRLRKHVRTRIDSRRDPWAILLAKLAGVNVPPKARQAYQQFMRKVYTEEIEPVIGERWAATAAAGSSVAVEKEPKAPFRAKVARELFAELPEEKRAEYATRAKEEAQRARAAYKKALKDPPSKSPQARHTRDGDASAIENVGSFVAPILQGIHERTGLHSVLILGGPIPKYGGDLRTIQSSVGSHFPQYAKERFNGVLALMKEYLDTVFSKEECLDSALPTGLDGANFTISPDSGSDDDSSDDNDSQDSSKDEEERSAPRKKARTSAKSSERTRQSLLKPFDKEETQGEAGSSKVQKEASRKRKAAEEGRESTGEVKKARRSTKSKKTTTASITITPAAEDAAVRGPPGASRRGEGPAPGSSARRRVGAAASSAKTPTAKMILPGAPVEEAAPAQPETPPTPPSTAAAAPPTVAQPEAPHIPPADIQAAGNSDAPPTSPSTAPGAPAPDASRVELAAETATVFGPDAASSPPAIMPDNRPFEFADNAPEWLRENVRVLTHIDLGCHYQSLVEALIRLEERMELGETGGTGIGRTKVARPTQVSSWIGAGRFGRPIAFISFTRTRESPFQRGLKRKTPYDAGVTNLKTYGKSWQGWWDSLQPAWRTRAADGSWERPDEYAQTWDWGEFWYSRQNGCVSIVATLYFWGSSKQAMGGTGGWGDENREVWEGAIADAVWMLEGLEQAVPAPPRKKRGRRT
ncbi:hypothetical protein C8R43DRAFT_946404 [Mycena crocata]|nr:hypothetical protein C8R43DRAFT_946404 [Mycena crocata]